MQANRTMLVRDYVEELRKTRKGKPMQVREALDVYLGLWDRAVTKGVVSQEDPVEEALAKIDKAGGLYEATD